MKNAKYLAQLADFEYAIEDRIDPKTNRMKPMYVCKHEGTCNQMFPRSWNLLDHVRIHYNIRPFECPHCGFKFTQKGNLNKHMLKHLTPKQRNKRRLSVGSATKYTLRRISIW